MFHLPITIIYTLVISFEQRIFDMESDFGEERIPDEEISQSANQMKSSDKGNDTSIKTEQGRINPSHMGQEGTTRVSSTLLGNQVGRRMSTHSLGEPQSMRSITPTDIQTNFSMNNEVTQPGVGAFTQHIAMGQGNRKIKLLPKPSQSLSKFQTAVNDAQKVGLVAKAFKRKISLLPKQNN